MNKLMALGTMLKNSVVAAIFLKSLPKYYIILISFSIVHSNTLKFTYFRQRKWLMVAVK